MREYSRASLLTRGEAGMIWVIDEGINPIHMEVSMEHPLVLCESQQQITVID